MPTSEAMSSDQIDPPVGRNRKRILDPSEINEEEGSSRRGPNWDWNETLRSIGVPNKKGFIGNDSQYNDMIDQGLADNFEDSLSGLGVDITTVTGTYNMSEAIMALPNIALFRNEVQLDKLESFNDDDSSQSNTTDRLFKLLGSDSFQHDSPAPSIHQLLQHQLSFPDVDERSVIKDDEEIKVEESSTILSSQESISDSSPSHLPLSVFENNKFQYILGAATSVAVQVNEESLTYLNQGQSYEIKIKMLGDITRCQGIFYHTKIRICFHERRLQYMQKEQLESWKKMRPGERILEIDIPLSYSLTDIIQDPNCLNQCEFDWEPSKEVGVYLKVNCISTEFTPKKHGGEKGVPFRLQIETSMQSGDEHEKLHACACQIKVFKLKGADRKHKQDKEKILKKPISEAEKFQKQCECTILQEIPLETMYLPNHKDESPSKSKCPPVPKHIPTPTTPTEPKLDVNEPNNRINFISVKPDQENILLISNALDAGSTSEEAELWLTTNRFDAWTSTFRNYCGTDLLRLTRSELIEICGLLDGIRLYNELHSKNISPRLTLYVCLERDQPYHALYMKEATLNELVSNVTSLLNIPLSRVQDCYTLGPNGVHVLIKDEVIRHWENESLYTVDIVSNNMYYNLIFEKQLSSAVNIKSSPH